MIAAMAGIAALTPFHVVDTSIRSSLRAMSGLNRPRMTPAIEVLTTMAIRPRRRCSGVRPFS